MLINIRISELQNNTKNSVFLGILITIFLYNSLLPLFPNQIIKLNNNNIGLINNSKLFSINDEKLLFVSSSA